MNPSPPAWLPNAISVLRILLVPVWVLVAERHRTELLLDRPHGRLALVAILATLALSDLLDGWLARRFGLTSHVGAVLDAVADKLAQVVLVAYLTFRVVPELVPLPLAFFVLLVARDLILAIGWLTIARARGHVVSEHRWHGKASSALLFATVFALLAGAPEVATRALVVVTGATVVGSTADYFRIGLAQLRGAALDD